MQIRIYSKIITPLAIAVLVTLLALSEYLVRLESANRNAQLRDQIMERASSVRADVEHEVNTTLNLAIALVAYIAARPEINQDEFAVIARKILDRTSYVINIGLARNNTISHIYPLQGNEKALGLRYEGVPSQWPAVQRAISSGNTVIAGPVDLVQGGRGLIGRIPIFLDNERTNYWGISSIVMDLTGFLAQSGIDQHPELQIALRGKDSLGPKGDVIYGDRTLFEPGRAVSLPVKLAEGSWVLAVAPATGWQPQSWLAWLIRSIGTVVSIIMSVLTFLLLRSYTALQQAKLATEAAIEHKNRFFTNMTHELRTPLTAIHGVIRLINSGVLSNDSGKSSALLQNAERNCSRLIWLINDILDLKKLESGRMSYHMRPENFVDVVKEALDEVQQYSRQHNIAVAILETPDTPIFVECDKMRLIQVVVNLLSNAIKFSPAAGQVEVKITTQPGRVRLEVRDHGAGVPPDKIQHIFDEFSPVQSAPNSPVASTGLGLNIAKQIVQHHHGTISCFNHESGGGLFFVELPRKNNLPSQQPDSPVRRTISEKTPVEEKAVSN